MKKLAKIAETGLGSYISSAIMGFFVGALPRQRDDFNFFTASEAFPGNGRGIMDALLLFN